MKHLEQTVRVAIDETNTSIQRDESKCVKCGECARICSKYESVNNNYRLSVSNQPICVNCGQCVKVCPTNCLSAKEEYHIVKGIVEDKTNILIASVSPAVRVALGDEFGLKRGSFVEGKLVALLKKLGFNYVLDTNFSADLTVCQEAQELINRLNDNNNLPMFTSCCPSWVKFVETFYPKLIPNLSTCKSPIAMQGALVKTYFATQMNLSPEQIVHVVITPCTAKKYEIRRKEFNSSAIANNVPNMRDSDYSITTVELAKWAKENGIELNMLQNQTFDRLMGTSSSGGVIFGNSGGVMESALRTAYYYLTGNNPPNTLLNLKEIRGLKGVKEACVEIGSRTIKVASVSGLTNAKSIIKRIKAGNKYDFIEVMACPGGCIGGGGQPKHLGEEIKTQKSRMVALTSRADALSCKSAHQNEEIQKLFDDYLSKDKLHMLHTTYFDKSAILGNVTDYSIIEKLSSQIKVVTICGSMKYEKQMIKLAQKLECENGYCVIQCVYELDKEKLTQKELNNIVMAHYKKIDISDIIYVVNIDNYIGNSTKNEIEYAKNKGKKIIYYNGFNINK